MRSSSGPTASQRRQRATQHVIAALELLAAFHGPKVGHILDHADFAVGAAVVGADRADIAGSDIAAIQTFANRRADAGHRLCQRDQQGAALLDQVQDRAPRRPGAKARQLRHQGDQVVQRLRVIGHGT